MYFVDYGPIKERLRSRSVSDKEALPYLILWVGLTALVCSFSVGEGLNAWKFASGCVEVVFAVAGILYAYECNGGDEGFDLLLKYVLIGWIVSFRCLIVLIPIFVVFFVAGMALGFHQESSGPSESGPFEFVSGLVLDIIVYQRIGRHIRDTRSSISEVSKANNG